MVPARLRRLALHLAQRRAEDLAHVVSPRRLVTRTCRADSDLESRWKRDRGCYRKACTTGHIAEYVASEIFGIRLQHSANHKGIDGHFTTAPLFEKSVNIKYYGKQEGLLDIATTDPPDFYLVLTGTKTTASSSRGKIRPWCIEKVYLFERQQLSLLLERRNVAIGTATSVQQHWIAAEIYPIMNPAWELNDTQREQLSLFAPTT
jgi:hypothetical protein